MKTTKTTKLLSIIPTLLLAFICLCAAAKNTGEPIIAELLLTAAPLSAPSDEPREPSPAQGYEETALPSEPPAVQTEAISPANTDSGSYEHAVREMSILRGTSENDSSKVHFSNRTDYNIDINDFVAAGPAFALAETDEPQVLIVHTHATEAYLPAEAPGVNGSSARRSTSPDENMVAVGERLIAALEAGGVKCLHDTSFHDHPAYSHSYDRAAKSIKSYLEQYPSIKIVVDVHRDAIWKDDGTRVKPTVLVDGKKAAQIMIISGTDKGGLTFDSWRENLGFAAALQYAGDRMYPGLLRPLNVAAARYNMHFTSGSLLFEVGSDVNTLDEALYSAELMGRVMLDVLKK